MGLYIFGVNAILNPHQTILSRINKSILLALLTTNTGINDTNTIIPEKRKMYQD